MRTTRGKSKDKGSLAPDRAAWQLGWAGMTGKKMKAETRANGRDWGLQDDGRRGTNAAS